jgi:hypothetical protein
VVVGAENIQPLQKYSALTKIFSPYNIIFTTISFISKASSVPESPTPSDFRL